MIKAKIELEMWFDGKKDITEEEIKETLSDPNIEKFFQEELVKIISYKEESEDKPYEKALEEE